MRRGPLWAAGAARGTLEVAATGRLLASLPSARMVTVRTRFGSFDAAVDGAVVAAGGGVGAATGGAAARSAMEAVFAGATGAANTGGTAGGVGTFRTTGCSSRGTMRSAGAASPTRSWMTLLDCASDAGTTLVGVLSATITGAEDGPGLT